MLFIASYPFSVCWKESVHKSEQYAYFGVISEVFGLKKINIKSNWLQILECKCFRH